MKNKIKSVWDNKGKTFDRYTIVLNEYYDRNKTMYVCLCLSDDPQGFSEFAGCMVGRHLGKKMKFEELPENIQKHVLSRINE